MCHLTQQFFWSFCSEIPGANSPGTEGFNEPCLLELDDGSLLCLMRSGGSLAEWDPREDAGPLVQSRSTDGGRTWPAPHAIACYGVDPHAVKLADGTLVASSGRPGVYLLVDFSGTAGQWQRIPVYSGPGSSYTTLVETEPNKVLLFYDESAFCLGSGQSVLNRIMNLEITIAKTGART